jgi:carbon-monoxide dehydrogenase iron sulfur subunit
MKGVLVVRVSRCTACRSCELACAVEHSVSKELVAAIAEMPPPCSRVSVEAGDGFAAPLQCRQCTDAPCVLVCPTHALRRQDQDSPVVIDQELCVGCRACVLACPFGVIRMDKFSHTIIKCDQCADRLERGELPACVSACPTRALEFKDPDAVTREKKNAYLVEIAHSC